MDLYDSLFKSGISVIESVQTIFENNEEALHTISYFGHPDYALSILFPIIASFDTRLAAEVFFGAIVADWSNAILKWIFMEDRPYWWVHETKVYGKFIPEIHQTSITCETGPGFPSGHLMSTASVLFIITCYLAKQRFRLRYVLWLLYFVSLVAVSLSRLYVAAHFPHQCLVGALLGYAIAHSLSECSSGSFSSWKQYSRLKMLAITTGMLLISFGVYWTQKALGIDPQWSIKLAFKWCKVPENIHVSTTPIFSIVRNLGSAYGVAIISPTFARIRPQGISPTIGIAVTLFCCGILRYIEQIVPSQSAVQFYVCQFVIAMMYPLCLLAFVPRIAFIKPKKQ